MAVQPRISRIRLTTGGGSFREWLATANQQDTFAGEAFTVTVTQTSGGAAPPAAADTIEIGFRTTDGTEITFNSVTVDVPVTRYMRGNPNLSTGTARKVGTLELSLEVRNTTSINAYTINSGANLSISRGGGGDSLPVGHSTSKDRGWVRGTATARTYISNVAPEGAVPAVFAYSYDVYHRIKIGTDISFATVTPYQNRALTHTLANGGTISSNNSSSSTDTWDFTFTGDVDNRYPVASTLITANWVVPNDALTGQPWTVLVPQQPQATALFNPSISWASSLFQLNDNVIGTPPMSKNRPQPRRTVGEIAYILRRAVNANSEGINGISYTRNLVDRKSLVGNVAPGGAIATQTQGGEAGWGASFLVWDEPTPSGLWDHTVTISAPAKAVGLGINTTSVYTLISANPSIVLATQAGPTVRARHFTPGETFQVGVSAVNLGIARSVILDVGTPKAAIIRLADASLGAQAGYAQYLEADGVTWTSITSASTVIYTHTLTESRPGSNVFIKTFTPEITATWGEFDLIVVGEAEIDSVPYSSASKELSVGKFSFHDAPKFDPTGLFS